MEGSLSHPIGKFSYRPEATAEELEGWTRDIRELPAALRQAVSGLSRERLDTPYRDGGWTVRQVVHHLADSHINAFVRLKLALTEECPRIKPYDQDAWSALPDARSGDIEPSLSIVEGVHARWVLLLGSLAPADRARAMDHPERGKISIDWTHQLYAWHCRHHLAHIAGLRQRKGW